jgi:hypothetical protein
MIELTLSIMVWGFWISLILGFVAIVVAIVLGKKGWWYR